MPGSGPRRKEEKEEDSESNNTQSRWMGSMGESPPHDQWLSSSRVAPTTPLFGLGGASMVVVDGVDVCLGVVFTEEGLAAHGDEALELAPGVSRQQERRASRGTRDSDRGRRK